MAKEKKKSNKEEKEVSKKNLVGTRGRVFEGFVIKKFLERAVIEYERTVFIKKYERFYKKKSKIHARIPEGMVILEGDYVKVRECRPLSKIIHHIVIEKVRSAEAGEGGK
jgi:small subunit ribosomal protein S17